MRFGKFVLSKNCIHENQLKMALDVQHFRKEKIGRLLVDLAYIDQSILNSLLSQFLKVNSQLSLAQLYCKKNSVEKSFQDQVREKFKVVVIELNDHCATVICDYFCDNLVQSIEIELQRSIHLKVVKKSIFKLLIGEKEQEKSESTNIILSQDISCDQKLNEDNPFAKLVRKCLTRACELKASDIHFEPFCDQYIVRFRIHGVLQEIGRAHV